jgi:hypothetical protein
VREEQCGKNSEEITVRKEKTEGGTGRRPEMEVVPGMQRTAI